MSASVSAIIAIILSLGGLYLVAGQNAKRYRAAELPAPAAERLRRLGLMLLLLPLPVLIIQGQTSPFILWLGALSVLGLGLALRRPS